MPGRGIRIARHATRVSVRELASGRVWITHPRGAQMALAAVVLAAGIVLCGLLMSAGARDPMIEYALLVLFVGPGVFLAMSSARPRPALEVTPDELVVRYGPVLFERAVARLPLDMLELRVTRQSVKAVRYDGHAVSRRILASMVPLRGQKPPETDVGLYVLEVRTREQEMWLGVLGSQVASEIENARLAVAAACGRPPGPAAPAEADLPVELVEDEPVSR